MEIKAIKTRIMQPPKDDLFNLLDNYLLNLENNDILVIASKIVAIHQGRCLPISENLDKDELIKKEADYYISREEVPGKYAILTIKENFLAASAGIDESNANNYYILLPKKSVEIAKEIHSYLSKKFALKNLGIIITDSRSAPLRVGVTGISIASYGIELFRDYRGTKDLFDREIKISRTNIVDSLASAAVLEMGEGKEQTPLAIIKNANINFSLSANYEDLKIPQEKDIYLPLLKNFKINK